jgi:ectoine hydroxylase-related dioxygenase (phytanoyl-CoA dioxygenase family)
MSVALLSLVAEPAADAFHRDGFIVLRGVVDSALIEELLSRVVWLAERESGESWSSAHSVALGRYLSDNRDVHSRLVAGMQVPAWLKRFAMQPGLTRSARQLLGPDIQMLRNVSLDIDSPLETTDLRVWHQDHFYARGSKRTVKAHIPLQDTAYREGCLMVMPGSHRMGKLAHNHLVLGSGHFPTGIDEREIRLVPLRRGDVLLTHSLLLTSNHLNMSPATRFVVNARFIPWGAEHSDAAGGTIPVPRDPIQG